MKALIIVDMQRDFCEGGSLAVTGGTEAGRRIYSRITRTPDEWDLFVFTKDWHNPLPDTNEGHFSQTPDFVDSWPVHCVADSPGSDFEYWTKRTFNHLYDSNRITRNHMFFKGQGHAHYSGFQGVNPSGESLNWFLSKYLVNEVDVVGVAGEHCVQATALDAISQGFHTRVRSFFVASLGGDEASMKVAVKIASLNP